MASKLNELLLSETQRYTNISIETAEFPGLAAVPSMFNKYSVFSTSRATLMSDNAKFDAQTMYDYPINGGSGTDTDPYNEGNLSSAYNNFNDFRTPTADMLIKVKDMDVASNKAMPYSWTDFLYCKHYGRIPNNHMITLRRYPFPTFDNLSVPNGDVPLPIAQAITWFGDETGNKLSEIMNFTFGLKWESIVASVQNVDGNEQGMGAGVEKLSGENSTKLVGGVLEYFRKDRSRFSGALERENEYKKGMFGSEGPYWNQILGPVNVINETYKRNMGMNFKNDITLTFEYSANSIGGVNTKMAMLDLLSNFGVLTYNNAKFWGGAMRYFPDASHKVLFMGSQNAFYGGDIKGYSYSLAGEMSNLLNNVGDLGKNFLNDPMSALKGVMGRLTEMGIDKMASSSQPKIVSIRSLLTGAPVGEWHLVVGNPLNPIAMIGNIIVDDVQMQFGNTLGPDDFPTEIKFIVTLKHGKPRDLGDIQSMFNMGDGRLTYAPIVKSSAEKGTFGDNYASQIAPTKSEADRQASVTNAEESNRQFVNDNFSFIKNRIGNDWGSDYAASENLNIMLGLTKMQF
jgi:hypothetical protein